MVQISTVCTIQPHVSSRAMIIITDWETSNSNTCSFISTVFFIYLKLKQGFMLFLHFIHKEVIKHLAWFKTYCLGFIILFFSQVLVLVLDKNPKWPSHIAILLHVNYMMWFSYPLHSLIFSFVLVHGNIIIGMCTSQRKIPNCTKGNIETKQIQCLKVKSLKNFLYLNEGALYK